MSATQLAHRLSRALTRTFAVTKPGGDTKQQSQGAQSQHGTQQSVICANHQGELTMRVTMKFAATSVAALGAIGAAAVGVTSIASVSAGNPAQVQLAAVGAPLPQDPPAPAAGTSIPTAGQLTGLLNSLADPNVSFENKGNLVEGGISGMEAHFADKRLSKAAKNGQLPLAFNVANIQPGAQGSATADVSVSGPKLANPVTQNITFVNQGGWMLSRASAMELLQAASH